MEKEKGIGYLGEPVKMWSAKLPVRLIEKLKQAAKARRVPAAMVLRELLEGLE